MKKKELVRNLILKIEELLNEAENNNIRFDVEEKILFKINPCIKKSKLKKEKRTSLMRRPVQEQLLGKGLVI
tara:strand:+ start:786 stop:1001 length:216 start_codon:yes stop_codon:yes gene_type:complete